MLGGIERGGGAELKPFCLGGVSITEELVSRRQLLGFSEAWIVGEMFLWRDESGVDGIIECVVGSVGRDAGRFGTRNRPLPEDGGRELGVSMLSRILEGCRDGVSRMEPSSVGGSFRLLSFLFAELRELKRPASGPENEMVRRIDPDEGIMTGDTLSE